MQEQSIALGSDVGLAVNSYHYSSNAPVGNFRFTKFTAPAEDGYHLYHSGDFAFTNLTIRDCEFWNGFSYFSGSSSLNGTAKLNNNLFYRSRPWAQNTTSHQSLTVSNNLVVGASAAFYGPASDLWKVYDNAFEACTFFSSSRPITNGYNAYINCGSNRLTPTNDHIVVLTSLAWQSGLLGDFYQPTNSALIGAGSLTNSGQAGLYHYTTTTNQVKESNSPLDIGYHYVAVSNGLPVDTDGDSQADYFEDTNGNGVFDAGDFGDWTNYLYTTSTYAGMNNHTHPLLPDWRPDTMGAVGPDHFVETLNSAVAVYAKSNGEQLVSTSLDNFFRLTNAGNIYPDPNKTGQEAHAGDPRILYDHESKRWFACALDIGRGDVLLAVSKSSDPVGTNLAAWVSDEWTRYVIPTGTNNQSSADQPRLGVDGNGVYVVVYFYYQKFSQGINIRTSRVAALPKSPFLNLSAPTVQSNYILDFGPSDSFWSVPAVNFEPATTNDPAWFLFASGTNLFYNQLKWTNGFGSAPGFQMTNWGQLAIPESFADLGTYNGRFTMATLRRVNSTLYAWTCRTIGVNSNGNNSVLQADRTAIEWFKIDLSPTVTITNRGRIFDSAATDYPMLYYDSSLAVNKNGDMITGFSGSSGATRMAAYYWGRLNNGVSSSAPIRYYVTTNAVSPLNAIPSGDYSYTSLDPVDELTIWTIQEYAEVTNSTPPALTWGTAFVPVKPY